MMTERMKAVLERTEKTLCRHLEDLNDDVDRDGGRIKDHMTIDGIRDCLESIKCHNEIVGNAEALKQPAASTAVVK
ncbi:MAG: hypothetical protein J6W54_03445 [Fibrobacter sp.]|uniref:hypothetical protein n=1 Tax=Fibrobacter sp. TaxID=35828 RepID=UPI001AFD08E3|nr:hypothetical protein [Fibrobacter sp.]MBO7060138.1 hypothetical protein [Fibrobacter sp.]